MAIQEALEPSTRNEVGPSEGEMQEMNRVWNIIVYRTTFVVLRSAQLNQGMSGCRCLRWRRMNIYPKASDPWTKDIITSTYQNI